MKQINSSILLVAGVTVAMTAFAAAPTATYAQAEKAQMAHKVGLIDMAHLFKEYKRFSDEREVLKGEIAKTDEKAKAMGAQIQTLAKQLKSGNIAQDSPDYQRIETQMLKLKSDFDIFRQQAQREFLKKESEIYKEIYVEVSAAVEQYAKFYKYTLVLRFSRNSVNDSTDPRELIQNMNNLVIYHREEFDITDRVLTFLNQRYEAQAKKTSGTSTN